MEGLLADPEKVGVIVLLLALVFGFVRGTILAGAAHERQMTQLRADCQERIKVERERADEWRAMAQQGSRVAREVAELAKQTSGEHAR